MAYADTKEKETKEVLKLSTEEEAARTDVYDDIDHMMRERDRSFPHFNDEYGDRTLKEFVNDSDRRLNGYTLPREEQGKDDWQNNLFDPITRNKAKALIAGVALSVPEQTYRAVNKNGVYSARRAELMKQLVRHSRLQGNPQIDIFFEAWEALAKGTVVKFDGYLKTKYKRKFIKSYDLATGEITFDEREVTVDDRPVDLLVPLLEFYIWDFNIFNVQDQPKVAWIQHYNRDQLEGEFGQYKNFKHILCKADVAEWQGRSDSMFLQRWGDRVKERDDFEVVRYFNKLEDRYEIWCNGVPLLIAPLVWGKEEKMYPFSKTIFEPFVGGSFFYGKSFPAVMQGIQDVDNMLVNSILDKLIRGLDPMMLVGLENKDLFDNEDELVTQDNKIYVPNVNAVKPMPVAKVDSSDIAMLEFIARKADMASVDISQSGMQSSGNTATEVAIADERARQLKGMFFMFLEDLWMQKTRLRIVNILMNYTQPRMELIIGKDGTSQLREALNIVNVPNTELSDGSTGTLGVQIAQNTSSQFTVPEIEARENVAKQNGTNYKLISVTSDYLDDWDYDFEVVSSSIANEDRVRKETSLMSKLQALAAFFPEYFAENKEHVFTEFLDLYGENIEEYKKPKPAPTMGGGEESVLGLESKPPANATESVTTGA